MPRIYRKKVINSGWFKKGQIVWAKGKIFTEEHIKNIKFSHLGQIPWNKNTKGICKANSGSWEKGCKTWIKGLTKKTNKSIEKMAKDRIGENNPAWKGGITSENIKARKGFEMGQWRKKVFEYDNYTCWICEQNKEKLVAHHLKKFSEYPELRFVISNGLTLCDFCHRTYTKFR